MRTLPKISSHFSVECSSFRASTGPIKSFTNVFRISKLKTPTSLYSKWIYFKYEKYLVTLKSLFTLCKNLLLLTSPDENLFMMYIVTCDWQQLTVLFVGAFYDRVYVLNVPMVKIFPVSNRTASQFTNLLEVEWNIERDRKSAAK